jgi:hypothetical protein
MSTPSTLSECFAILVLELSQEDKEEIVFQSEDDFTFSAHLGIGVWMRNQWMYQSKSAIYKHFQSIGFDHEDDISELLLRFYHRHLTGKPLEVEALIEKKLKRDIEPGEIVRMLKQSLN